MNYGLSIPNFGAYADVRALVALARDVEAAGWDGLFLWGHIQFWKGFGEPAADPWVALAAVAISTEGLRLGTLVIPVARRRAGGGAFDVVLGGATSGDDPVAAAALVAPYGAAGMTWWLEYINPYRGSFAEIERRVRQGPPGV